MIEWTVGFETPPESPAPPYVEQSGSADFMMGFMASVVPNGWMVTTIKYEVVE